MRKVVGEDLFERGANAPDADDQIVIALDELVLTHVVIFSGGRVVIAVRVIDIFVPGIIGIVSGRRAGLIELPIRRAPVVSIAARPVGGGGVPPVCCAYESVVGRTRNASE